MNEQPAPIQLAADDAAWVLFKTPQHHHPLIDVCQDVHRLLRTNPCLEFIQWRQSADNGFHLQALHSHRPSPGS
jgi:hypothetical protein